MQYVAIWFFLNIITFDLYCSVWIQAKGTTLPHVGKIKKIEQYFTFTSNLVGKSVYISLKDDNSYKLILYHLHTNVPCCTQQINLASKLLVIFTNLESQPPPCCIDPKIMYSSPFQGKHQLVKIGFISTNREKRSGKKCTGAAPRFQFDRHENLILVLLGRHNWNRSD